MSTRTIDLRDESGEMLAQVQHVPLDVQPEVIVVGAQTFVYDWCRGEWRRTQPLVLVTQPVEEGW